MRGASLAPVSKLAPWQNTTSDLRVVVKIRQKLMQTLAMKTVLTHCGAEHAAAKSMMQNEGCGKLWQSSSRIRWSRRPRRGTSAQKKCKRELAGLHQREQGSRKLPLNLFHPRGKISARVSHH